MDANLQNIFLSYVILFAETLNSCNSSFNLPPPPINSPLSHSSKKRGTEGVLRLPWSINEMLKSCPPFLIALSHLRELSSDMECGSRIALVLKRQISIWSPDKQHRCNQHDIELEFLRQSKQIGNQPNKNDKECNTNLHQRCQRMRPAIA